MFQFEWVGVHFFLGQKWALWVELLALCGTQAVPFERALGSPAISQAESSALTSSPSGGMPPKGRSVKGHSQPLAKGLTFRGGSYVYVVQQDDFLGFIATRFYGTRKAVDRIMMWNGIKDSSKIRPGQRLVFKVHPLYLFAEGSRRQEMKAHSRKFQLDPRWIDRYFAEKAARAVPVPRSTPVGTAAQKRAAAPLVAVAPVLAATPRPDSLFFPAPAPWNAAWEVAPAPLLATVADRQYAQGQYATAAIYFQQARLKAPALGRFWLQEGFALTFCGAKSDLSQWRASLARSPLAEEVQSGIVQKVTGAGLGNAPCRRLEILPEHFLAEELLILGEALVGKRNFSAAAPILRWARKQDPSQVKAWFLEIKCHKEGKDEAALAETLSAFRTAHPALSNLPFLKR